MSTILEQQQGFFSDGRVRLGIDETTHAFVPNPLDNGLIDLGASDAKFGTIYAANGFPTNTPLLTSTAGAILKPFFLEEEITLATGATTTDSTANLLPANSLIVAVTARVTTTITAAATGWSLGDASTSDRFSGNETTLTAGTTKVSSTLWDQSKAAGYTPWQAAAAKVRVTCAGGNPGAGKIRVCVFGFTVSAPTS